MGDITDRLLGGKPTAPPVEAPQESITEKLLNPASPFGTNANPMMAPTPESERPPNKEFNFPDIIQATIPGLDFGQTMRLAGGLLFATDDATRVDIVRNNIPGADLQEDKFGNPFIRIPVQGPRQGPRRFNNFYLNAPGPSAQDILQLGAVGATAVPAGRVGAAVGSRLLGQNVGRVVGGAAAEGALSLATDTGLQALGSEQPVNLGRAATATLAGGVGEALLPVVAGIIRGAVSGPRRPIIDGQLIPEARAALQDAGLDPSALNKEFIERLNVEVGRAADPAQAVRAAEASSLPTPVPLTRGDVTRTASDQIFEDQARKGSFGRTVESVISARRSEQQAALRANIEGLQADIGTGTLSRNQGGEAASQALQEVRQSAENVVTAAYATARNAGQAGLSGAAIPNLSFNLERAAVEAIGDLQFAPKAQRMLAQLAEDGAGVGSEGSVLATTLFNWRRQVSTLANDATDPTEARALRAIRNTFDSQVVDIVERGLLEGNQDAVDLWMQAIRSRREFGAIWEAANKDAPNYLVDRLTQTLPDGGQSVLRVPPEAAANLIFGSSKAGLTSAPQLARQLQRLQSVLVEGGRRDAWDALREEAFVRLTNQAESVFDLSTSQRSFSGAKFANALDDALTRNGAVMRTLFTAEEVNLMQQIQRVGLATTTTAQGGMNFSNTASAGANIFRSTLGKLVGRIFGPALQGAAQSSDIAGFPFVLRALRSGNAAAQRRSLTPGVGAAAGAISTSQPVEELRQ